MYRLIIGWQEPLVIFFSVALFLLLFLKVKSSFGQYKMALARHYSLIEKEHDRLSAREGTIYDQQLKFNAKLSEISRLYEITKDMSGSLHFDEIFKILAVYLHRDFLFSKVSLILVKTSEGASSISNIYEAGGIQDSMTKAKGVFPKLEVLGRQPNEHDKKIYKLLERDKKHLQIVRSADGRGPYSEFLPEGAETYTAAPVIIEDHLTGILTVSDLPVSELDKFSIVVAQFTLEAKRIMLYERVEEMAITDGLTKAFAKRHIQERLDEEFDRSSRHGFDLSFLMVDIDYFKNYNDTYGHLVGDAALKDIVMILKANTREVDMVGRFGGEEFCVILPETKKKEAQIVAERIREVVEGHKFRAYDESTSMTVSIGIAIYPEHAEDAGSLIENADRALYAAKKSGRNQVCVYNS